MKRTDEITNQVRRLRRRAITADWLFEWTLHLAVALAAAGAFALCARGFAGWERARAAAPFAIVGITPFTAWLRARGRFLSERGAAAWFDVRAGATGLLLTDLELADARWHARAEALAERASALPKIRLRPLAGRVVPSVLFAIAALWIPVSRASALPPALGAQAIDRLDRQLAALEEQVRLDEKVAIELKDRIQRMREELPDARPEAAYESIDRMHESLQREAEKAAEAAVRAMENFSRADADSSTDASEAQAELEQALADLRESGLTKNLPTDLQDSLMAEGIPSTLELAPGQQLAPGKIAKLSEAAKAALAEKMKKLAKEGLPNKKMGAKDPKGQPKPIDWDKFKDHKCEPECKEGGS
jgi:hypothetical protein